VSTSSSRIFKQSRIDIAYHIVMSVIITCSNYLKQRIVFCRYFISNRRVGHYMIVTGTGYTSAGPGEPAQSTLQRSSHYESYRYFHEIYKIYALTNKAPIFRMALINLVIEDYKTRRLVYPCRENRRRRSR